MTWLYRIVTIVLIPYFKTVFKAWKRPSNLDALPKGGIIFASNHCSNAEGPLMNAYLDRPVRFLAKQELFRTPWGRLFFKGVGCIPIKRHQSDVKAFEYAVSALKDGHYIGIFPEGTRGDGKRLLDPHTGVIRLALLSGAPIVPVGISGGHIAWPKGRTFPRWGQRVVVRYGRPWYVPPPPPGSEYSYEELKGLSRELLYSRIAPLLEGHQDDNVDYSSP